MVLIAICWAWPGSQAFAASVAGAGSSLNVQPSPPYWQVETSLEQNTVTAVAQAQDGYLWLGTYHGLVRFDGDRFFSFYSGNTPELPNGLITSLFRTTNGVLWIGHETGHLTRFSDGGFHGHGLAKNWPGGAVEAITIDELGDLWLLCGNGVLCRWRDGYCASVPGGVSVNRKICVERGPDGRNWVVANGLVYVFQNAKLSRFGFEGDPAGEYYERVLPSRKGGLWVVSSGRLRRWEDGQGWGPTLGNVTGSVTAMLESRSGLVLCGTLRDGLYLFYPGQAQPAHLNRSSGLSHDWVRCVCEDHEGNFWLGTGVGLDALRARRVQVLAPADEWQGCTVLSFSVASDGTTWVGTEGAALYRFDQNGWTNLGENFGISNAFVWSVLTTRDHNLLVGTWGGGLLTQAGERFAPLSDECNIKVPVRALYESRSGDLWVGTTPGLHRVRKGRVIWSAGKEQLVLPDVRTIAEAPDGTLWFGMSGGGLGSLERGELRQITRTNGLGSDYVSGLLPEADGTLWIATSDQGLIRMRNGRFSHLSVQEGLPTRVLYQLVDDQAGNLWIGSQAGILRAKKSDLNRCADRLQPAVSFLSYGKADGLTAGTCTGGFQPGACRTPDGRLWFPTPKGLAVVDPVSVRINEAIPPVHVEDFLVDGEAISFPTPSQREAQVTVPPGKRTFQFRFTGLSFAAPEKVKFKYKLENLESEWVDANSRVAEYSYLRPGSYRFRVKACNNDGVWNERGATLTFTVEPFFWQTMWFQTLGIVVGAGSVGATVLGATRRRHRRKLEQLERQRSLERERARIARDIHDDLGASLTRISMLSQTVRSEVREPEVAANVDQIYGTARELTRSMDEIVWAVNPRHDTLDSLVTYLGRFAQQFLNTASIRCRLDVPLQLPGWTLTSEIRHNVYLALKEALNNVLKHAGATEVRISLVLQEGGFTLTIGDNGKGFNLAYASGSSDLAPVTDTRVAGGNGLRNMRKRLEQVGANCDIQTAPGEGTRITFVIPLGPEARLGSFRHQNT